MNISTFKHSIGYWLNDNVPEKVKHVVNDTHILSPNDAFLAIITSSRDGHDFLLDAKNRGASCAIVSRPNPEIDLPQFVCENTLTAIQKLALVARNQFHGAVIGISGSYGKTTTRSILSKILNIKHNTNLYNHNGELGIPMTMASIDEKEPFAVVEIGIDAPGIMDHLLELVKPQTGIVTGINTIHIDRMKSEDVTASEKVKLLQASAYQFFSKSCLRFPVFSELKQPTFIASQNENYFIHLEKNHFTVEIFFNHSKYSFQLPKLMSHGAVADFVLAACCALRYGIAADVIQSRILDWQPEPFRGEVIQTEQRQYFVDCYNSNPTALKDSLEHFERLFPGTGRLFVIGAFHEECFKKYTLQENHKVANLLTHNDQDYIWIIGKNSQQISQYLPRHNVKIFLETEHALNAIQKFHGTVFLKGHHFYHLEKLIQ